MHVCIFEASKVNKQKTAIMTRALLSKTLYSRDWVETDTAYCILFAAFIKSECKNAEINFLMKKT